MKRAHDAVVLHRAAVPEMRAKVSAVRIQHVKETVVGSIGHQVAPEVLERPHLVAGELPRPPDLEPPTRTPVRLQSCAQVSGSTAACRPCRETATRTSATGIRD